MSIIIGSVTDDATWEHIPDGSVHMCVTSPPYWALRSYLADDHPDKAKELGLEKTPEEYVSNMVAVFRHVWDKLRDDAVLFLNIGDSYCAQGGRGEARMVELGKPSEGAITNPRARGQSPGTRTGTGLKPKDLVGIPWMLAFALRADGWYLRQEIIWHKPNPMPESCRDRCTKAHESIFLLTKRPRYFMDMEAIKEPVATAANAQSRGPKDTPDRGPREGGNSGLHDTAMRMRDGGLSTRNKRSVWTVATQAYPGAHFATFPPKLITPCILAGTSEKGVCPECGAPWERVVERSPNPSKQYNVGEDLTGGAPNMGGNRQTSKGLHRNNGNAEGPPGRTTGWRPTCDCYDALYHRDFTKTRSARKFWQKSTWWKRVKKRAVPFAWDVEPATVLDLFDGAGTTRLVAMQLGRSGLGIELNPEYAKQAQDRIDKAANPQTWTQADAPADAPLFAGEPT